MIDAWMPVEVQAWEREGYEALSTGGEGRAVIGKGIQVPSSRAKSGTVAETRLFY